MSNTQPGPPHHHPRRISTIPINLGFRGQNYHDRNHWSEASRFRASLVSRFSLSYVSPHTQHSISSHLWRKINHYLSCDSLSRRGVRRSDSLSGTFFSRSERNILRLQVSPLWSDIRLSRGLSQTAWATVIHMSHKGSGMKLRDLARGSANPTSFMPALHILRSRFMDREADRRSRKSYESVPRSSPTTPYVLTSL